MLVPRTEEGFPLLGRGLGAQNQALAMIFPALHGVLAAAYRHDMNSGVVVAKHWQSGNTMRLVFENGLITESASDNTDTDWWIAPALVDLQVNGFLGVDFQSDSIDRTQLERATTGLHRAGCSKFMLTLITEAWPYLLERLAFLRKTRSESDLLSHAIVGWHIEGPFLSPKPGFYGAHDPTCLIDPLPEHIEQLRAITGNDPLILTIAPERHGAVKVIKLATSLGIKVFLGHTDAPAGVLSDAIRAGATGFTHIGNGCPHLWDRHDNITWRVLDLPKLAVTIIPDGVHVSPSLFRIVHKVKPRSSIIYISDAMAAAGMPPGRYKLRHMEIYVAADGVVRMPGSSQYAGSALCPINGVQRAVSMLGCSWCSAWENYSVFAAQMIGLRHDLVPGSPADFCLIRASEEGSIVACRPFVRGSEYPALCESNA